MKTEDLYKNPQELWKSLTKESTEFFEGFASSQGQEMMKEFMQAWNSLATQTVKNPKEWVDLVGNYQKTQFDLWTKVLGSMGKADKPLVTPSPGDRRFSAKEWQENPVFDYMKQSYLLAANLLTEAADRAQLDEANQKKLKFYTKYFIDAMSPTNFATTNPEVIKYAIDTKGQSLIDACKIC